MPSETIICNHICKNKTCINVAFFTFMKKKFVDVWLSAFTYFASKDCLDHFFMPYNKCNRAYTF